MDVTDPPEGRESQPVDIPAPPQPPANTPVTPAPPVSWDGPQVPEPTGVSLKPKTDVGFFIFGFLSPVMVSAVVGAIGGLLQWQMESIGAIGSVFGILSGLFYLALPVAGFVFFLTGKRAGNVRMWSFGKGVLWAYAVGILIGLLAFGTCMITLGNSGF